MKQASMCFLNVSSWTYFLAIQLILSINGVWHFPTTCCNLATVMFTWPYSYSFHFISSSIFQASCEKQHCLNFTWTLLTWILHSTHLARMWIKKWPLISKILKQCWYTLWWSNTCEAALWRLLSLWLTLWRSRTHSKDVRKWTILVFISLKGNF